jgi:hypothetical protein
MSTPHKKPKAKNNAKPKNASKKSAAKNNAKQTPARKTSKANHTAKSKTKSKQPTLIAKKPKAVAVYVVVREIGGESPAYTEPDIVFASKPAAIQHAEKLNREMRSFANPFEFCNPRYARWRNRVSQIPQEEQISFTVIQSPFWVLRVGAVVGSKLLCDERPTTRNAVGSAHGFPLAQSSRDKD